MDPKEYLESELQEQEQEQDTEEENESEEEQDHAEGDAHNQDYKDWVRGGRSGTFNAHLDRVHCGNDNWDPHLIHRNQTEFVDENDVSFACSELGEGVGSDDPDSDRSNMECEVESVDDEQAEFSEQ
jgi:hypothetical protein